VSPLRPQRRPVTREGRLDRAALQVFPVALVAALIAAVVCLELGAGPLVSVVAITAPVIAIVGWALSRAARSTPAELPPRHLGPRSWLIAALYVATAVGPLLLLFGGTTADRIVGGCLTALFVLLLIVSPIVAVRRDERRQDD
jgi:hypothetical protein